MNLEKKKEIVRRLRLSMDPASDHLTYHAVIDDTEFQKLLLSLLEEDAEWDKEDEKKLAVFREKIKEEIKDKKTPGEKFRTIKKILKIGGTVGLVGIAASGIGFAAYQILKKK